MARAHLPKNNDKILRIKENIHLESVVKKNVEVCQSKGMFQMIRDLG